MLLGPPLAFAFDRLLRPPGTRAVRASLLAAAAGAVVAFCALVLVLYKPAAGIAFGLVGGALASAGLSRWDREPS